MDEEKRSFGEEDPEAYLERFPAFKKRLSRLFKDLEPGREEASTSGRTVGDFRILREIGSGGMATVYEAEQISLKRRVALKVLSPSLSLSKRAVQKFQREAEAGGRQVHPGIVAIFATGEEGGIHFIAQEMVPGGYTLADRLEGFRGDGLLPMGYFRRTAEQVLEVAEALEHAHVSGVIHRDVKPSNILITEEDRPKVTDFGLARVENALALSRTGDFSGTPFYMSPEQAMGRRDVVDARTDVFSLGVTLYEALTLVRPFDGDSSHEVLRKIVSHEPRNLLKVNARVPRDLAVICAKTLEKNPDHRYASMGAFAEDLRRFLSNEPILAKPVGRVKRLYKWIHRHRRSSLAASAVLLAVLALAILFYVLSEQRQQERMAAMEQFKPAKEALEWSSLYTTRSTWRWCLDAAPHDPGGHLFEGVFLLESGQLEEAADSFQSGLENCSNPYLERDLHHLLGLTLRCLALETGHLPEQRELLGESAFHYDMGKVSDPLDGKHLVLRDVDTLELNSEHPLIQLHLGVALFHNLYKGGDIAKYQQAIRCFEKALQYRPNDVAAHLYLGRVYYFLARFHHFYEMTGEAERHVAKALELSGDRPYHMINTTLGQVELLKGNDEEAIQQFVQAIGEHNQESMNIHNAFVGMGTALCRQGRSEEALRAYGKASALQPDDPHVNIALTEYYLFQGDQDKALHHAVRARKALVRRSFIKRETFVAAAYLAHARVLLALGDHAGAMERLEELCDIAVFSPRDFGIAVFLIATIPGEMGDQRSVLASALIANMPDKAWFKGNPSPIGLAAVGVHHYLREDYDQAVASLEQAMAERRKWPIEAMEEKGHEDMRDLYFITMSRFKQGTMTWKESLASAEEKYRSYTLSPGDADILTRVRSLTLALVDS